MKAPWFAMLLALTTLFAARADASGRPLLFPNPAYVVPNVKTADIGDVNGDGLPDLVFLPSALSTPEAMPILIGRGFGVFETGPELVSGTWPREIDLADLNQDGRADIVELDDIRLLVRLSLGDAFAPAQVLPSAYENHTLEEVDFDGDGHLDLVVPASGGFRVAFNHGDGTFEPLAFVPVSGPFMMVFKFADFNNDGLVDVVSSAGTVSLRSPLGGFGSPLFFDVHDTIRDLLTADLDRDGRQDVIVTGASAIHALLGNGDGAFTETTPLWTGTAFHVQVLDFNHDGIPDVALDGSSFLRIQPGLGDGTFGPPISIKGNVGSFYPLLVGDVDRDGWQDIMPLWSPGVQILLNGRGNLFGRHIMGLPPSGPIFLRDLNEDGLEDLVTAGEAITVFLRRAGAGFEEAVRFAGAPPDGSGHRATLLDADGDDRIDVGIAGNLLSTIALGRGDGGFEAPATYSGGEDHDGIAGLDLDLDGDDDLAVSCWESVCFRNAIGEGVYGTHWRLAIHGGFHGLISSDLDKDGRKDLVGIIDEPLPYSSPMTVASLIQQPDGTFLIGDSHPIPYAPFVLHLEDLNGDGWSDLMLNMQSLGLGIFYGTPGGHFSPPVNISTRSLGSHVAVADFDLDGHVDIALFEGGLIEMLLGDGNGFPTSRRRFFLVPDYSTVNDDPLIVVGEFNDDGLPDLALSSRSGAVSLVLALGEPTVTWHVPVADAGSDQIVECPGPAGAPVVLDGTASSDADSFPGTDDGIALFEWITGYGTAQEELAASGPQPTLVLQEGTFVYTLRVTDWTGQATTDEVTVTVQGTLCNRAPVAAAGPDREAECQGPGGAVALLDGDGSTDLNSTPGTNDDIETFEWFTGYGSAQQALVGSGRQVSAPLPFGSSVITLRTTDRWGLSSIDEVGITVRDTTPPVVIASLDRTMLWPPNHRMVRIDATASVADLCGPATLGFGGVSSSEPDDAPGPGDGRTSGDVEDVSSGILPSSFLLRAERDANGSGRTYTISYRAVDSHGNVGDHPLTVHVPHDIDGITEPLILRMEESVFGSIVRWDPVPGARWYNVIVGDLAALRALPAADDSSSFCVALGLSGLDTTGSEVNVDPDIGQAFFFLVEYDDGQEFEVDRPSGYGTESAPYDRTPVAPSSACP